MSMNRVVNHPDRVVEDMLGGWLLAHGDSVEALPANPRVVKRARAPERGKVGVVTGGGSGHEPAFLGYVGDGMVDAVAVGEIFSSPTAKSFLDAIRTADGGAGVACLYGNYAGDNMNVGMAREMAEREGIVVRTVVANDDVPSAAKGDEARRRGVAGEIFMWKVGAAKAALGASLDEVIAAAQKAIANTRSIGVGLSACVIPAVGKANFHIEPGTMEVGIGHHGEPGIDVRATASAAEMAQLMLDVVLPDLPFGAGDRVAVLISGLGATPVMEQYILYGEIAQRLLAKGITVAFNQVGNLFTSLEMMGVTLTLMKLDDELETCLKHPCRSVGLSVPGDAVQDRTYSGSARMNPAVATAAASSGAGARARTVSGATLALAQAGPVVRDLIDAIVANRQHLSEIDGLIGDGDHGINMAKGFTGCGTRLDALGPRAASLPAALEQLSQALMDDIGGSMGPLYGRFFLGFVDTLAPHEQLDAALFGEALAVAVANVQAMGKAQVGDKTLIDTLVPARDAYAAALANGSDFAACLQAMGAAAQQGRDATKALQARIGRSARLGARSIGVLDAGATSCCLILQTLAASLQRRLAP
ncbi:PTS-dependent dihydroxyacetone kinase, dihydroxyacetone-binding subunit DhaK [Variovorax boronicumulans]|uniref:dihydroxyacetone kinase subunit DhaL n=1 Tax=Variovorax boronicumulans TaxID=436515 RepID=UPI000BB3A887|nr:PTS-dependent dihydroxyacetone kinase, dihydroxyacetone-binding subunit DhaK [Variovorax boronicumulans]